MLGSERYIHTDCVIPLNIGDQESEEYIKYETSLNERIADYEQECKSGIRQRNLFFEPTPPREEYFGKQPPTEEEIREIDAFFAKTTKPSAPKCPICGSTRLTKISSLKKAAKIYTFGIFGAGDVGKTYKCENCGAKF